MENVERERSDETRRAIGKLCVGADWACTTGDVETLGNIACQLAAIAPEPLHCELIELADLCRCDPDRAVAEWLRLKAALRGARDAA